MRYLFRNNFNNNLVFSSMNVSILAIKKITLNKIIYISILSLCPLHGMAQLCKLLFFHQHVGKHLTNSIIFLPKVNIQDAPLQMTSKTTTSCLHVEGILHSLTCAHVSRHSLESLIWAQRKCHNP